MSAHDPGHEELLRAILAGDGDREDLLRQLGGCDVCEAKLMELEVLADLVALSEGDGELSTEALPAFEAGEQAARDRLRELSGEARGDRGGADRGRRAPLIVLGLLAAAAVLAFALLQLRGGGEGESSPGDFVLSDDALEFTSPRARAVSRDGLAFTWTGELEAGERFVLYIQNERGRSVAPSPVLLTEARWQPTAEIVSSWPEVLSLQVAVENEEFEEESRYSRWLTVELKR